MKKIFTSIAALLIVSSIQSVIAQDKLKEGKMVFEISYPDADMPDQQMAMMPTESVVYFKDENARMEMTMGGMGKMVVISDHKSGDSYVCMDMMGKKTAMKTTKDDVEKAKGKTGKPEVKITDETKKIAGYTCTKAIVTYKDNDMKPVEVWFTKDIAAHNSSTSSIEGIDGFMMEFSTKQQGMTMKMLCKSVEKTDVSGDMFKIPEGYKVMTQEEMMKMRGGN